MTDRCKDCQQIYILPLSLRRNRLHLCPGCKDRRHAEQKLASQRKRHDAQRRNERELTDEAQIDAVFQAALKEIKRARTHSLEPHRSYQWLYREPRS